MCPETHSELRALVEQSGPRSKASGQETQLSAWSVYSICPHPGPRTCVYILDMECTTRLNCYQNSCKPLSTCSSDWHLTMYSNTGSEAFPSKFLNLSIQLWHPEEAVVSMGCLGPSRRMKCSLRKAQTMRTGGSSGYPLTQRCPEILGRGRYFVVKKFGNLTGVIEINSHFAKVW